MIVSTATAAIAVTAGAEAEALTDADQEVGSIGVSEGKTDGSNDDGSGGRGGGGVKVMEAMVAEEGESPL